MASKFGTHRFPYRTITQQALGKWNRELKTQVNYDFSTSGDGLTPSNIKLHIDHIKPYSLGGETTEDNLRTLCQDCNLGKSKYKKVNKGSMGNREWTRLSQTAIGFNGWVRKLLCNRFLRM
jgi:5-methylcytosine-specific restriction endonuclease McrA